MSGDNKKAKATLIAVLAIASFGTMVLLPRAQAQPTPAPQCTPEEMKDFLAMQEPSVNLNKLEPIR